MRINSIQNTMTSSAVFKETVKNKIEVVEIERRSIVFQISETKDGWHSMYLVSGTLPIDGRTVAFEFTGKMSCLETTGGFSRVRFDLLQYDRALWLQFLEQLQKKQDHADKVFTSIKGES